MSLGDGPGPNSLVIEPVPLGFAMFCLIKPAKINLPLICGSVYAGDEGGRTVGEHAVDLPLELLVGLDRAFSRGRHA